MKTLTTEQSQYIKGYANALKDLAFKIVGSNMCGKSYDPFYYAAGDRMFLSYAFNMKDGGRSHDLEDYIDVEEITNIMLAEMVEHINAEMKGYKE